MKAISLLQPWATLVALGAKRIETRSWSTDYRGPLAIHASSRLPGGVSGTRAFIESNSRFERVLLIDPYAYLGQVIVTRFPLGQVVAMCDLVSVRRIHSIQQMRDFCRCGWRGPDGMPYKFELNDDEIAFGDYASGRYAWLLHNIVPLEKPVPAKGRLGLWEWAG
jgi:hypothetical protein